MRPGKELIFLPLGGSGEIGMNVNLYGCNGKWIMVDLGMTFADPNLPGVELVLPDLSFIEDRQKDLLGIVLTHGHEDHIGAIPYLIGEFDVPLYATPFTAGLIRKKLIEEGIERDTPIRRRLAGNDRLDLEILGGKHGKIVRRARHHGGDDDRVNVLTAVAFDREKLEQPDGIFVRRAARVGRDPPATLDVTPVDERELDVGVAGVDDEQHQR